MSKKPQPQKTDNQKHKIQHVNQQNEPYLRALQKRVRNLNKKLTEISELENKGNLKPQQIEKVNRKKAVQEEIAKIQENASYFRQVYVENAQHYRNNQLKELEVLARGLAVYHSGVQSQEQAQLSALWRVIEQSDKNYPTLNGAIEAIGNALKDFANDRKLQKALSKYVEEKGEKEFKSVVINQEKIVNELVDDVPSAPEPKVEEPVKAEPPAPAPTPAPEPVEEKKPEPKEEKVEKAPEVIVEKEPTPIVDESPKDDKPEAEGSKAAEEKKEGERPRRENRERPYKGKAGYKGNRKEGNQKYEPRDRERKQNYKPKYQEKPAEGEQKQRSSSSSSSSSSEARQFKKEEIKKLEDEGFTVVGKPKPKAKDPKERKNFYEHQHGKKNHHHGQPTNY